MRAEFSRALRHAALREIGGASANHTANRTDPGRDEAAVGQCADPDRKIDMIFQRD